MDRVNVKKLITNSTISLLNDYLFEKNDKETKDVIKENINDNLNSLSKKSLISNKYNVKVKNRTWEDEYPKLYERLLAKFYIKILRKLSIIKNISNTKPNII